jgi:hypothetical protein
MILSHSIRRLVSRVRAFHEDEAGEASALSNIMLLAIAALIVVALIAFGKTAMDWLKQKWSDISGSSV